MTELLNLIYDLKDKKNSPGRKSEFLVNNANKTIFFFLYYNFLIFSTQTTKKMNLNLPIIFRVVNIVAAAFMFIGGIATCVSGGLYS